MFHYDAFLSQETYETINYLKTYDAGTVERECAARLKPSAPKPAMVLAAADHNARMITEYQGNEIGLGNRREYLARLLRMLLSSQVDGIEATPDILEDILIVNYLTRQKTGLDFLAGKALIGTVNRGGLKGSAWELDDLCSGYTVEKAVRLGLDGVKFMLRIAPFCEQNKNTLRYCAELVNQAERANLEVYIESLYVDKQNDGMMIQTELAPLVKSAGVTAALGATSCRKWLELPLNPQYGTVAAATTCSVLVVPDEYAREPLAIVQEYTAQCGCAANVRGILLGRNVMYASLDPFVLAEAIGLIWHTGLSVEQAYHQALERNALDTL